MLHHQSVKYCWRARQIPATNIFPDTAVGNDAMCRFLNLTAAMPEDKATQAQNLRYASTANVSAQPLR